MQIFFNDHNFSRGHDQWFNVNYNNYKNFGTNDSFLVNIIMNEIKLLRHKRLRIKNNRENL